MKWFNVLALSATVALAFVMGADSPKSIVGKYEFVGGEEDGKPTPSERIKGSVVVIEKDVILGTDKDRKEFFGATYKLDTSETPWKISMVSKSPKAGMKAEGVVKAEGDTVWICYALPGGKTPTGFKTEEKQHCFKLKKVK